MPRNGSDETGKKVRGGGKGDAEEPTGNDAQNPKPKSDFTTEAAAGVALAGGKGRIDADASSRLIEWGLTERNKGQEVARINSGTLRGKELPEGQQVPTWRCG